jgi:SAM-dependent methyltransferase
MVEPPSYGDAWAADYDAVHAFMDPTAAVEVLRALAAGGRALELGIGTGRVALPLAAHGVEVHGVDASEAMVAALRAKPGGNDIPITMGDFADVPVEGQFELAYVVFNTLFVLLTQERQVDCFGNVARHLVPGGAFVVEAFVPDLGRFDRGQRVSSHRIDDDRVDLEVTVYDAVAQRLTSQQVTLRPGGVELRPVVLRFAWPAEIDLMARLAGLRLRERWGDWDRRAFDASSGKHVSIYERPAR